MSHEQSLRLPARLRGVVHTEAPRETTVTRAPLHAPAAVEQASERHQVERFLANLSETVHALRGHHQQAVANLERLAVDLAWSIAARFLHQRLKADEFPVDLLVRQTLEPLEGRQPVTVMLHPHDLALLQRRLAEAPALDFAEVRWVANPALGRGDCQAQAGDISVWADFVGNLTNLRRQLLESLDEAQAGGA